MQSRLMSLVESISNIVVGFALAVYCYKRSCRAVREGSLPGFLAWHTAWHWALPLTIAWFFVIFFYLPGKSTYGASR